jgi:hypothetical protein
MIGEICKMVAVFIFVQNAIGYFFTKSNAPEIVINENGVRPISHNYLMNVLKPGD